MARIKHNSFSHELDVELIEDELDMFLRNLPSAKSSSWDGITSEVFKQYYSILKSP